MREIKDLRIKIPAKFKHAKFKTHIENSSQRNNKQLQVINNTMVCISWYVSLCIFCYEKFVKISHGI